MVAYSYKRRFVTPIRIGLGLSIRPEDRDEEAATMLLPKRQTIRAVGLRRHARPGETLQHYCGMRHPSCFLIGTALCSSVRPINIKICNDGDMLFSIERQRLSDSKAEAFAHSDGFAGIEDMWLFWRDEHPGISSFNGYVIGWEGDNESQTPEEKHLRARPRAER